MWRLRIEDESSLKEYFLHKPVLRGTLVALIVCVAGLFGLAIYAHNFVPGSYLLSAEPLLLRLAWVALSTLCAGAIVKLLTRSFPNLASKVIITLVIGLAMATALLSSVFYFHLEKPVIDWLHPLRPGPIGPNFGINHSLSLGESIPMFLIMVCAVALILYATAFVSLTLLKRLSFFPKLK